MMPQPEVKGEVVVRRHEVGGVVGVGRVDVVAARGLQADHGIAEAVQRQGEALTREEGVVARRTPAVEDLALGLPEEIAEMPLVLPKW